MSKPSTLGLPSTYGVGTASPSSVEGFLFPATYTIDPGIERRRTCCNQMISKFVEQDRSTGFAAAATGLRLTPYQELIIASIAQAEAQVRRGHAQGGPGDPEPDRRTSAAADRRDERVRRQAGGPGPARR